MFSFLIKPKSITQVLMRFVSPRVVRKALREVGGIDALVIARVAELENFSCEALLNQVAAQLKLPATTEIKCPSSSAIGEFGMSLAELKLHRCLPQEGPGNSKVLAVSDLGVLDVCPVKERGYSLVLTLDSELSKVFAHLDSTSGGHQGGDFTLEQIQAIITQLAVDADALGAKEVIIGLPSAEEYEFVANDMRFSGKMHPELCVRLVDWLTGKRNVRIKPQCRNFKALRLSLPNDGRDRVVFLTWSTQEEDLENPSIPTEAVSTERELKVEPDSVKKESMGSRILLVEDDERYAKLLQGLLERNGFKVTHFNDAELAFDALGEVEPQLIISDIHLPTVSGSEFTRKVRESDVSTPILVLTSDDHILLEAELIDLGADAFLRKDEDVRIILSWCNSLCRKVEATSQPRKQGNDKWTVH
jgi:CheY-like chemotaxis protein